jgi:hypothetical protein
MLYVPCMQSPSILRRKWEGDAWGERSGKAQRGCVLTAGPVSRGYGTTRRLPTPVHSRGTAAPLPLASSLDEYTALSLRAPFD